MSHRKHTNKNASRRKGAEGRGPWVTEFSPFKGIPHEELVSKIKELGEKQGAAFPIELIELEKTILSCDPVHLLSTLSFYSQSALVNKGGRVEPLQNPLEQHHVELIQALMLRYDHSAFSATPAKPQDIQSAWDRVRSVSEAYSLRRFAAINTVRTEEEQARLLVQEQLRMHTQVVRNWGYPNRVAALLQELLGPIDGLISHHIGCSLSLFFDLSLKHQHHLTERQNRYVTKLTEVLNGQSIQDLVNRYYAAFEITEGTPAELVEYLKSQKADINHTRSFLVSHSELSLAQMMTFSASEFGENSLDGDDLSSLTVLLDRLSYKFSDLAGFPSERFFLDNPCWYRPIIKLPSGMYFEPLSALPLSFPFEIIEDILKGYPEALKAYIERRSEFLEGKVEADMRAVLTGAHISRGNEWEDDATGTPYENDLLVIYDCFALVIEAKSGHVSAPAKRGGMKRVEKVTEDLIASASEQSQRFADWIVNNPRVVTLQSRGGVQTTIDLSKVRFVIRLSVLLDDVATVQTMASEFQKAGLISRNVRLAVTMTLADFQIVLDILETPSLIFHYLHRRSMFGAHTLYMADEIDLLGFYLDTGFNIGETEFDGTSLVLTGMSEDIDAWYMSNTQASPKKKPSLEMTQWWSDMILGLEQRHPFGWLQLSLKLLSVPFEDQRSVERRYHDMIERMKKHPQKSNKINSILMAIGPPQRKDGFVFLACRDVDWSDRDVLSQQSATSLRSKTGVNEVMVIGRNIDRQHYPWSFVAFYYKGTQGIQII